MNLYIILIGLAGYVDLGESMESDKSARLAAIYNLLFSLGPAWHGSQSAVLLKTTITREAIVQQLSSLIGDADFIGVLEIEARSQATIGWNPDEEGFDALLSGTTKFGISPSGVYPVDEQRSGS